MAVKSLIKNHMCLLAHRLGASEYQTEPQDSWMKSLLCSLVDSPSKYRYVSAQTWSASVVLVQLVPVLSDLPIKLPTLKIYGEIIYSLLIVRKGVGRKGIGLGMASK